MVPAFAVEHACHWYMLPASAAIDQYFLPASHLAANCWPPLLLLINVTD